MDKKLIVKKFEELTPVEVYEILRSRATVFMVEQKIICVDPDRVDYDALHCFYMENGSVTAYLRAYAAGDVAKVGRVLTLVHGRGEGTRLMRESIPEIVKAFGCKKIAMSAQKHAEGFYARLGFETVSEEYLEEGIPHVAMEMKIL